MNPHHQETPCLMCHHHHIFAASTTSLYWPGACAATLIAGVATNIFGKQIKYIQMDIARLSKTAGKTHLCGIFMAERFED